MSSSTRRAHSLVACLDDAAPLENETFRAHDFFSASASASVSASAVSCGFHDAIAAASFSDSDPITTATASRPHQPQRPQSQHQHQLQAPSELAIPLRHWIRNDTLAGQVSLGQKKLSVVRKTTVAYAIAELLHYLNSNHHDLTRPQIAVAAAAAAVTSVDGDAHTECTDLDNFIVRVANSSDATIEGVDMISPVACSVRIIHPFFLSDDFFNGSNSSNRQDAQQQVEELGKFLEVEIQEPNNSRSTSPDDNGNIGSDSNENMMCHLFGVLVYEIYSGSHPFSESINEKKTHTAVHTSFATAATVDMIGESEHTFSGLGMDESDHSLSEMEPSRKKTGLPSFHHHNDNGRNGALDMSNNDASSAALRSMAFSRAVQVSRKDNTPSPDHGNKQLKQSKYTPLKNLGLPASLSLLVKSLLICGWGGEFRPDEAMPSLKAASDDLHLLLQDPDRFLFDRFFGAAGSTRVSLDIKQNKFYGREKERSLVTDLFCRVSLTGESEALFIEGFSGSGKSKLVESVVSYVDVAGGYIIQKKFDQISQERPMSVVISAFNALCALISQKTSPHELNAIVVELMTVFGNHLSTLARLLPNVALLSPELNAASHEQAQNMEINVSRVYFVLQLFMRVVSSRSHPVMLFLDDLQWADSASLDVLHCILSDIKGSSCMYFVGSYRSNEVPKDHAIFRFMSELEPCNVQLTKIRLDSMEIKDINHIISDALGTVPRICKPLSQLVLRKTEGNPLFVLECLRSLVDRDLLQYSFRERRWVWDMDKIASEDLADNVCELLSTKMAGLPKKTQLALKIASCFGNVVNSTTVQTLMAASLKFSTLQAELEKAVDDGFMNKDDLGSSYLFSHDKVREAAYGLIREEERNQLHHNIGMLLYVTTKGQDIDSMIFLICDQINHGVVHDPQLQIKIAELNYKAASKAMGNSNFAASYFYSNAAVELLPQDNNLIWENHYDLCRGIFLVLGNAAYNDGHIKEATSALDKILHHGTSLKDKLDAYYLKISLLHARQEGKGAYDTCLEVIKQLGETVPESVDPKQFVKKVEKVQAKLSGMTEEDMMGMKTLDNPFHYSLMQFYNQVCFVSYFVNPPMLKWYACRLVELTLEHGVCKYSALGIMRYSMVFGGKLIHDVQAGYRVGKMALKLLERFDSTDSLPTAYLIYYGFTAVHIEPFQSCADMLKRGFEIGLSTGDAQSAFICGIHYIQKSMMSGMNLPALKKECDYQMRLIDDSQQMTKMYTGCFQESIAMLIDKQTSSSETNRLDEYDVNDVKEFSEALSFHRVLRSFWLGHYDRCLYHAEMTSAVSGVDIGKLKNIIVIFYGGISCFHSSRKYKTSKKLVTFAKQAIDVMKEKGAKSSWNYLNKIHLLEAEIFSATNKREKAKQSFETAISAARSAKFVHEQGLACELAALHYLKCGEHKDALLLFKQASECYTRWGSQIKVDSIAKQTEKISMRMRDNCIFNQPTLQAWPKTN